MKFETVNETSNKDRKSRTTLDYKVLLRACNNYLKGYKKAYNNAKNNSAPYSQVIEHYEDILEERNKLLKLLGKSEKVVK